MRGTDQASGSLFGGFDLEDRIALRHRRRKIRRGANGAPARLAQFFTKPHATPLDE